MIPKMQRDSLLATLANIDNMLSMLPHDDIIMRAGFEGQRNEILEQLAQPALTLPEKWARAGLFFGGEPVVDTRGIDAGFASDAINKYQDIVAIVAASRRLGQLSDTGPIPDRKTSRLHITGVLRGSFGFDLAELEGGQAGNLSFGRTQLAEDVEEATRLMASASESDEAFADAVADMDARVVKSVGKFFDYLRQRGATVRLVAGAIDKSFSKSNIAAALERTEKSTIDEMDMPVSGTFGGALPGTRRFEFFPSNGNPIRGGFEASLKIDEISALNRKWSGMPCIGHFRRTRITAASGGIQERHTLLRMDPPA